MNFGKRITEPSSAAGATLVGNGLVALIVNWRDPAAWLNLLGGVMAILMPERGAHAGGATDTR
jgi:hypothetical protein